MSDKMTAAEMNEAVLQEYLLGVSDRFHCVMRFVGGKLQVEINGVGCGTELLAEFIGPNAMAHAKVWAFEQMASADSAMRVDAETVLDRVTALAMIAGYDAPVVKWALTQAAHELRQVPTQSFWNAADELEGIVRDKTGEGVGPDPHAEVPA